MTADDNMNIIYFNLQTEILQFYNNKSAEGSILKNIPIPSDEIKPPSRRKMKRRRKGVPPPKASTIFPYNGSLIVYKENKLFSVNNKKIVLLKQLEKKRGYKSM